MSFLKGVHILNSLSSDEKEKLLLFCQDKIVPAWEVVFTEWEEANAMYILKKWSVSISKKLHGRNVLLWYVHAEELLWEMALFSHDSKRMATAKVAEESELVVIPFFSIKELMKKYPELLEKIKHIVEDRLLNNKLTEKRALWIT